MLRIPLGIVTAAILLCLCFAPAYGEGSATGHTKGFDYPRPTGEFQVGTDFLFLEDPDRPDDYSEDPDDRRWISVKAYYPAVPPPGAKPTPDGVNEFNMSLVEAGVFDSTYLSEVLLQPTASYLGAPVDPSGAPWPIIIYSSSGVMTANVFLFEELASHGYVVLSVGHPYWC
ncbi:MAG: hypothetical protein PVF95_14285, partial [bacterium]